MVKTSIAPISRPLIPSIAVLRLLLVFLCWSAFACAFAQTPDNPAAPAKTPEQAEVEMLNRQVAQLYKGKQYKEALPHAERAVKLSEKAYGQEHPQLDKPLTNLAAVQAALDEHGDAAKSYRRLLKLEETKHGAESAPVAATLSKLGWEELLAGDAGAAEKRFKRGLELREKLYGAEGREVIPALSDLALVKQRAGKLGDALDLFTRLLALQRKHLGNDHLDVSETLIKRAALLRQAGRKGEADLYEEQSAAIAERQPELKSINASGEALQGLAIVKVPPSYPDEAKRSRIQGKVEVEVEINVAGIVTKTRVISGPQQLRAVSEEAARQWRFQPLRKDGHLVRVLGVLTFDFHL